MAGVRSSLVCTAGVASRLTGRRFSSHTPFNNSYLEHESYNWRVTVLAVPRPIVGVIPMEEPPKEFSDPSEVHYIYVCHKQGDKLL